PMYEVTSPVLQRTNVNPRRSTTLNSTDRHLPHSKLPRARAGASGSNRWSVSPREPEAADISRSPHSYGSYRRGIRGTARAPSQKASTGTTPRSPSSDGSATQAAPAGSGGRQR